MILEQRQSQSEDLLKELQARFLAFRIDFGTLCNPLEEYLPIYEAIFELFRHVTDDLVKEHGRAVLGMFRTMFSVVLDVLAGSVETLSRALGAGLGILVSAVGAVAAEAAGAAEAIGLGPLTAFAGGAAACVAAVSCLVCLVDFWIRHGNHVRVFSSASAEQVGYLAGLGHRAPAVTPRSYERLQK